MAVAFNGAPAVTIANLTSGSDTDGGSSATTASVTPTANCLQLLGVSAYRSDSVNPATPTVTGDSLTWVVASDNLYDGSSTSRRRFTTFRSMSATPSAGALTIDFGGASQASIVWTLDEACNVKTSGSDGADAVVQVVEAGSSGWTTPTVTLAAFTSIGNATYGSTGFGNSGTFTVGSGFGSGISVNDGANISNGSEFRATNDTVVDATLGTSGPGSIAGVEVANIGSGDLVLNSASTTYSFTSHNVTGSNRYCTLEISSDDTAAGPTGVTWDGSAMTNLGEVSNTVIAVQVWGLAGCSTGQKTIALSGMSSAGTFDYAMCPNSFTGVHQTVPVGTVVTATGTSAASSVTVTTAANGLNLVATNGSTATTMTGGSGTTNTQCGRFSSTIRNRAVYSTQDTNTVDLSGSLAWSTIGVPLQPAGTAVVYKRGRLL